MKLKILLALSLLLPLSTHAKDIFADTACKKAYEYYFLDRAVANEDVIAIQYLLDGGADINGNGYKNFVQDCGGNYEYSSPLMVAVSTQNIDIVKMLLERGADVNIIEGEGVTVLDIAKKKKNKHIVDLLLKYGAKTYAQIKQ
ncbi:MAG: hypothetical protein CSA42_06150 [Gammaproteobacteria bacterium]|nr:MAG: hypothetical protein CSA42_06150 [Gammaproteobacteria bacterium]